MRYVHKSLPVLLSEISTPNQERSIRCEPTMSLDVPNYAREPLKQSRIKCPSATRCMNLSGRASVAEKVALPGHVAEAELGRDFKRSRQSAAKKNNSKSCVCVCVFGRHRSERNKITRTIANNAYPLRCLILSSISPWDYNNDDERED